MRIKTGVIAALLLTALSVSGTAFAAGLTLCVDAVVVKADASIQADGTVDAGAFIKPEAAPQSLAERSQESPNLMTGSSAFERRGSGPFSPKSLLDSEPAPLSSSVRRAHLRVYLL